MSNGEFVWFEYLTQDLDAGLSFYGETVGWKVQTQDMQTGPYHAFFAGEIGVGGSVPLPEQGIPPHWMGYIATDDVDATVKKAKKLGGGVRQPAFDVPGVGRIAILHDPQDATFAVYNAERSSPSPDREANGVFSWSELLTSDLDGARTFYQELFGWTETGTTDMGDAGTYAMFGSAGDEASRGGFMNKPKDMPVSAWVYYANTDDLEAAIARAKRQGGDLLHGPADVQGGRVAQIRDPQGAVFALHQAS